MHQYSKYSTFELMQLITIRCPHNITIKKSDYKQLISLSCDSECTINSVFIGQTSGQNMLPILNLKNKKITIDRFRIRQGDWFEVIVKYNGSSIPIQEITGSINKVFLSINTPRTRYRNQSGSIFYASLFFEVLFLIGYLQSQILIYCSLFGLFSVCIWLLLVAESPRSHWGKL
jgi:hypothetical protein